MNRAILRRLERLEKCVRPTIARRNLVAEIDALATHYRKRGAPPLLDEYAAVIRELTENPPEPLSAHDDPDPRRRPCRT